MLRFLCCLFFLCAQMALWGEMPYEGVRVAKVEVAVPNLPPHVRFSPQTVLTRLHTKASLPFSQSDFDADLKMLADEYESVDPCFDIVDDELYITLNLFMKPRIHRIRFCGNESVKTKKLEKELDIKAGACFERDTFITHLNKVQQLYLRKGYFEVDVSYELEVEPKSCDVNVIVTIDEGRCGKIGRIRFCGFTAYEQSELEELLYTQKFNPLLSWWSGSGHYHPEAIEQDKMIIVNFLQNQGYADAEVDIRMEEVGTRHRLCIVITACRGIRYRFGNITIEGNCLFTEEQIRDELLINPRMCYSPDVLRESVQAVTAMYGVCGYIEAGCDVQLALRPDLPIYDVHILISEGVPYNVGMVHVFGNRCTQTRVILNECLLCPGDVFNTCKMEGTEERLTQTGYFEDVNVYAARPLAQEEDDCTRDVYVEVAETDTGNLGIFFGFSSLESIFGGVDITERNFNVGGIPGLLNGGGPRSLRGGGEYLHLKANIGNRETCYLLQWTKPYFFDTPWIVGFDLEKTNNSILSRGYEIKTYGGTAHATYIMNAFLKYELYYRATHTRVSLQNDTSNPLLLEQARNSGLLSGIGNVWIYDSIDNPRKPTNGFRSRLSYELVGVGGNFDFLKLGYCNTYYYPFCKKGVFKFRADLQFLHAYGHTRPNTIPLSERLYLGGETTVRGYRNFIIGPKFANNEPRGGVSSYLLSEEYQHNLLAAPCIDAFVFVDAGFVSPSEFTLGRPAASVGFGLRIEAMKNMPVTIGLGYPIHPSENLYNAQGQVIGKINNAQRFFFAMGGCF